MKTLLKWAGIVAVVLLGIIAAGAAAAYAMSNRAIHHAFTPVVARVAIPTDSASIAWGGHIVRAIAKCVDCHGEDLGGRPMIDDRAFGHIAAPNITRGEGSRTARYSDADWVRTIRHGVKPDGHPLVIMPAEAYVFLSDADLGAVIAYVKSVPPVARAFPAQSYGPLARALIAAGKLPVFAAATIDQERRAIPAAPPRDTTAAYGDYLTQIGGCRGCHNPAMSGGKIAAGDPQSPPAANLTPGGIGGWTEADFVRVLREGKRWHSDQPVSDFMPWRSSGRMTDAEIHAIWLFLQTLPSKEMGQR